MNNGRFRKIKFLMAGLLGISIMILWIVIETKPDIREMRENTSIVLVHAGVRG